MPSRAATRAVIRLQSRVSSSLVLQELADHGAKRDRQHRLMQQIISARLRFAQPLGCSVAADEEGRDRRAECATYALDHIEAGFPVAKAIIGNDDIRRPFRL